MFTIICDDDGDDDVRYNPNNKRRLEVHHVVAIDRACTSAPWYLPTL